MSNVRIHPTAIVDPGCEFGDGVEIGPYCVLSGRVTLGAGVRLVSHVMLQGPVKIGDRTTIYPYACIGFPPQDLKFKLGDVTAGVVIGQDGMLREHVTIHASTKPDIPTTVGDRAFLMVNTHFGHDVRVGNDVTIVNNCMLAGHVQLGDRVLMGGGAGIAQLVRIGMLSFLGGNTGMTLDVAPFSICALRNTMTGVNVVGMRRAGYARTEIDGVRKAYAQCFVERLPKPEMIVRLREMGATCPAVQTMADFVASSTRGICTATSDHSGE